MARKHKPEEKEAKDKHVVSDGNWKGRVNKTRQDNMPAGNRDRVHDWDRRRSWSQEHKPRRSSHWLKFRG